MQWDKQTPGCFGKANLIFAGHPMDEDRAFEWMIDLRKRNIGMKEVSVQVEAYLKSEGASPDHIKQQIKDVQEHMKPWLLD